MAGTDSYSETIDDVLTLPSLRRDFAEWRRGRSRYAVWAINVDTQELQTISRQFQAQLEAYLLTGYCRQPHVTLKLCGFPCQDEKLDDDFGSARFSAQLAALADCRLQPFFLNVGQPDSFTSAAYFSVDDARGDIKSLRQILSSGLPEEGFPYTPHVSFGLYRDVFPLSSVLQRMAELEFGAGCQLEIDRVSWMTYEAAVIGGPLEIACEFDLKTGKLHVPDEEQMCRYFGPAWKPAGLA